MCLITTYLNFTTKTKVQPVNPPPPRACSGSYVHSQCALWTLIYHSVEPQVPALGCSPYSAPLSLAPKSQNGPHSFAKTLPPSPPPSLLHECIINEKPKALAYQQGLLERNLLVSYIPCPPPMEPAEQFLQIDLWVATSTIAARPTKT